MNSPVGDRKKNKTWIGSANCATKGGNVAEPAPRVFTKNAFGTTVGTSSTKKKEKKGKKEKESGPKGPVPKAEFERKREIRLTPFAEMNKGRFQDSKTAFQKLFPDRRKFCERRKKDFPASVRLTKGKYAPRFHGNWAQEKKETAAGTGISKIAELTTRSQTKTKTKERVGTPAVD